jgi:hypothetical protein
MARDVASQMIIQAEALHRLIRHGPMEPISTNNGSAPLVAVGPA